MLQPGEFAQGIEQLQDPPRTPAVGPQVPELPPPEPALDPTNPFATELSLRNAVKHLRQLQKQRDLAYLTQIAAAGRLQQISAQNAAQLMQEDTLAAAQLMSQGMAMVGEGWRVPMVRQQYENWMADFESVAGEQFPQEIAQLRQQQQQLGQFGEMLATDEQRLRHHLADGVTFRYGDTPRSKGMGVLETFLANVTFDLLGRTGDRQSRAVMDMVDKAREIARLRYQGEEPMVWGGQPLFREQLRKEREAPSLVPDENEYARHLVTGIVRELRDEIRKDPEFSPSEAERFINEMSMYAAMLIPIGAGAQTAKVLTKGALAKSGATRAVAKMLGTGSAKLFQSGAVMGAQAGTLATVGMAMPLDAWQREFLSVDVESAIKESGLEGERADEMRRAAEMAARYQNAVGLGAMVPAFALANRFVVGPLARRAGEGARGFLRRGGDYVGGERAAQAVSRIVGSGGMGASFPAIMEFSNELAMRFGRAMEGVEAPIVEDIGRAFQANLVADSDEIKPVQSFFQAAYELDVDGMADAMAEYFRRAGPAVAAFGGMEMLGVVSNYAGAELRGPSAARFNELVDTMKTAQLDHIEHEVRTNPELQAAMREEGVEPEMFIEAHRIAAEEQAKEIKVDEEVTREPETEQPLPPEAEAVAAEDRATRRTQDLSSDFREILAEERAGPQRIDDEARRLEREAEEMAREQEDVEAAGEAPREDFQHRRRINRIQQRAMRMERRAQDQNLSEAAQIRARQLAAEYRRHGEELNQWVESGREGPEPRLDFDSVRGFTQEVRTELVSGREQRREARERAQQQTPEQRKLEAQRRDLERLTQAVHDVDMARMEADEPARVKRLTRLHAEAAGELQDFSAALEPGTQIRDPFGHTWTLEEPQAQHGKGVWSAYDETGQRVERWDPIERLTGAPERVEVLPADRSALDSFQAARAEQPTKPTEPARSAEPTKPTEPAVEGQPRPEPGPTDRKRFSELTKRLREDLERLQPRKKYPKTSTQTVLLPDFAQTRIAKGAAQRLEKAGILEGGGIDSVWRPTDYGRQLLEERDMAREQPERPAPAEPADAAARAAQQIGLDPEAPQQQANEAARQGTTTASAQARNVLSRSGGVVAPEAVHMSVPAGTPDDIQRRWESAREVRSRLSKTKFVDRLRNQWESLEGNLGKLKSWVFRAAKNTGRMPPTERDFAWWLFRKMDDPNYREMELDEMVAQAAHDLVWPIFLERNNWDEYTRAWKDETRPVADQVMDVDAGWRDLLDRTDNNPTPQEVEDFVYGRKEFFHGPAGAVMDLLPQGRTLAENVFSALTPHANPKFRSRPAGPWLVRDGDTETAQRVQRMEDAVARAADEGRFDGLSDDQVLMEAHQAAVSADPATEARFWAPDADFEHLHAAFGDVAEANTRQAFEEFVEGYAEDVFHGPMGVAMRYTERGRRLVDRILDHWQKIERSNPEAGFVDFGPFFEAAGRLPDTIGALWARLSGSMRRVAFDIAHTRIDDALRAQMDRDPEEYFGGFKRALAKINFLGPTRYAGRIFSDSLQALDMAIADIQHYRHQLFGEQGLFKDIEEGSEADKVLRAYQQDPNDEGVVGEMGRLSRETGVDLFEIGDASARLYEDWREQILQQHVGMQRRKAAIEYANTRIDDLERRHAELAAEFELAKQFLGGLEQQMEMQELKRREKNAKRRARRQGVDYERPEEMSERLVELGQQIRDAMEAAGFRRGLRAYTGPMGLLKARMKRMHNFRLRIAQDMEDFAESWGQQYFSPDVLDVDADPQLARDVFTTPLSVEEGGLPHSSAWRDPDVWRGSKPNVAFGHLRKKTGRLQAEGLASQSAMRAMWVYMHGLVPYLRRHEVLNRWDKFLYGHLDIMRDIRNEQGEFAGHEAWREHHEVFYDGMRATSLGQFYARSNEQGQLYYQRWQDMTPEERKEIKEAIKANRRFREMAQDLGAPAGDSLANLSRVLVWFGGHGDPAQRPTPKDLADPDWVARNTAARRDQGGPVKVSPLLALTLDQARDELSVWRDGWFARVSELGQRAIELGKAPKGYEAARDQLRKFIDEQFLGATKELATGLVAPDGARVAGNLRQSFERLGGTIASLMSATAIGGPTNIRNAGQAGIGGMLLAYVDMGMVPGRSTRRAARRFRTLQERMQGIERGFVQRLVDTYLKLGMRVSREGVMPSIDAAVAKIGGWQHLNRQMERIELTSEEELRRIEQKSGEKARREREWEDEALRELIRTNILGGNRGDQLARSVHGLAWKLEPQGPSARSVYDVRRGRITRPGNVDLTNALIGLSEVFWAPFNFAERLARVLPYIDQYKMLRRRGASREDAARGALQFVHQTQVIYNRVAKMMALNHPIGRMFGSLTSWALHADGRFNPIWGDLPVGVRVKHWARMAALWFVAGQLGLDLTRVLMGAMQDIPEGVGEEMAGYAQGVGWQTEEDPIGSRPKGPLSRGYFEVGPARVALPNVPVPMYMTSPGPMFESAGDLLRGTWRLMPWTPEGRQTPAEQLGRAAGRFLPIGPGANWLRDIQGAVGAEQTADRTWMFRDEERVRRRWPEDPGALSRVARELGIESANLARFDIWLQQQAPTTMETRSWTAARMAAVARAHHRGFQSRTSQIAEDVAWALDRKMAIGRDPERAAELELVNAELDELWPEWVRRRMILDLPEDLDEARQTLRTDLRAAYKRQRIEHEVPSVLQSVPLAGNRRLQVMELTRILRDPYAVVSFEDVQALVEAMWGEKGFGVLREIPRDVATDFMQALQPIASRAATAGISR